MEFQPQDELEAGQLKPDDLSQEQRKEYLGRIKTRNKYKLIPMTNEEKKRIAINILDKIDEAMPKHEVLCEKIDYWDAVARMLRKEQIGSQGELPNYRMPLSFVTHEVLHANVMNVIFSPLDVMRCIPTAVDDVPKVNKVSVFGNWSMKNELDLFTKFDRLDHASIKNGESVAMMYWKKEYGIEIQRIPMKDAQGNVVYDTETNEPIYQEKEVEKLIYNAPYMEILSRKDYIQPADCVMGKEPEWEARIVRISYDSLLTDELEGMYYQGTVQNIKNWPYSEQTMIEKTDLEGENLKVGPWEKEFYEWYGRLRINVIEEGAQLNDQIKAEELEDEFIVVVHKATQTLCSIRKNRFPMKMRPFINDYFVPDDSGRREGIGAYELLDSLQKCYDTTYVNFVYGTELSNEPIAFATPTGNQRDEKMKLQKGYIFFTSDPNSVKLFQFPPPNDSARLLMELIQQWAQFMFGISDYAAGMQSNIDPEASGKKVQMIIDMGNVRLNMIIKRKNDTLKRIFLLWFLLYRDNMPPNKFMRVAGEQDDPWKFDPINYEDFALQSIPDFDLTGNILNANKQLEANKAIAVFQLLSPTMLFSTTTQQGLQRYTQLIKWLIDKIGDSVLSNIIGGADDEGAVLTPEEENALMLQGDETVQPHQGEDVKHHLDVHMGYFNHPGIPEQVKPILAKHIQDTLDMAKLMMAQMMAMQHAGMQPINQQQNMQMQGLNPGVASSSLQPPQNPMITNRPRVGNGMPINRMGNVNKAGSAGMPGQPGNVIPQ